MSIQKTRFTAILLLLWGIQAASLAQSRQPVKNNSPQINLLFNRVYNGSLGSFYEKLAALKKSGKGTVRIVHIGDSHIQSDFFPSVVRIGLQKLFGDAGRGIVFPYQVANSNPPADIKSFSNDYWQSNRLAHPEIPIATGISGFCIQTNKAGDSFNFSLDPNENGDQLFNRIRLFTDNIPGSGWELQAGSDSVFILKNDAINNSLYKEISLDTMVNGFIFSSLSADTARSFYGASLENGKPGVIYHSIGVNGARFDQYNSTPLFWKQLPALQADLYIISLGTNEAQNDSFNGTSFKNTVDEFLRKLKQASPGAAILITTAPDSYKGRRSNLVLKQLNFFLSNYCATKHIALWDLYRVTNSYGSARYWLKKGLMNDDKIHFQPEGYKIHGSLLLSVLKKGYENYASQY